MQPLPAKKEIFAVALSRSDEDLPVLELICLGLLDTKSVLYQLLLRSIHSHVGVDPVVKSSRGRCGEFTDPEHPKESEEKAAVCCAVIVILRSHKFLEGTASLAVWTDLARA